MAKIQGQEMPHMVVGIGASAGGLEAIERLFDQLPGDLGVAYVLVQHLSPDFKSLMNELLARHTDIPIGAARDGDLLAADQIYLAPPKTIVRIQHGRLALDSVEGDGAFHLPVDRFLESLAADCGSRGAGVILSGTGADGAKGISRLRAAGGFTLAQNPESAGFDGMPKNAIETGSVDVVGSPEQLAGALAEYRRDPTRPLASQEPSEAPPPPNSLAAIFELFRDRFDLDFTHYKSTTIHRRMERRMQLVGCDDLEAYLTYLRKDVQEVEALYRDLLVEVTEFFRDPAAFESLGEALLPRLLDCSAQGEVFRVWAPGCATGEEAYSIAMLLSEIVRERKLSVPIKVFATDVHPGSLATAAAGVYPTEAATKLDEDRRDAYFLREGKGLRLKPIIRERVVFAAHDVTSDAPFTQLDLISCRNLLIYLQPEMQQRVLRSFHFGLKRGGILLLGSSESVGELHDEFEPHDRHWKIFRKLRDRRLLETEFRGHDSGRRRAKRTPIKPLSLHAPNPNPRLRIYEEHLQEHLPAAVLIDDAHVVLQTFGRVNELLAIQSGHFSNNLLKLVGDEIRVAFSAALHRAAREKSEVVLNGIRQGETLLRLVVRPVMEAEQRMFLLLLFEAPTGGEGAAKNDSAIDFTADEHLRLRVSDLERELDFSRESLQTTVEELETSNEELQSTNEELVASNEELQSTNEELHSVNEELFTVNSEHQRKIDELSELTADLDNLLANTGIAVIFLDDQLRIRRFTPAAANTFHLLEQDIGRRLGHIRCNLEEENVLEQVEEVHAGGAEKTSEVRDGSGTVYLQNIRPYRTADEENDGVVLTYTDISPVKTVETRLARSLREKEALIKEIHHRVKNNLQVISSILRLQSHAVRDEDSRSQFAACVKRVRVMAQVHEQLYQSGDLSAIEIDEYLRQLANDQLQSLSAPNLRVALEVEACRIRLPMDAAIPIGLIVNELMTNALKHAFVGREQGAISVFLKQLPDQRLSLEVADDGVGCETEELEVDEDRMGLLLIRSLADQLHADLDFDRREGTAVRLNFAQPANQTHEG